MKIAFHGQIFWKQRHGGISRYFASICPIISNMDHVEAKIFAPFHVNEYLPPRPTDWSFGYRGVAPARIGSAISRATTYPLISTFGADVIHETYYSHLAVKTRALRALTVYDMIHEKFPEQFGGDATVAQKKEAIQRADVIACISESTRRDLIEFYPEVESKAHVTLLGFSPPENSYAAPPQSEGDYIMYVGQRRGYKNFRGLLAAYASDREIVATFKLVAVGGGPFSNSEREEISRLGVMDRVIQVDANDEDLANWYRGAATFIYPSQYEGFGIPPLEAMAANCPVICSPVSSLPEVCGNAALYTDCGDPEQLASALRKILSDTELKSDLIKKGLDRLRALTWDACAQSTMKIYRNTL